MIETCYHSFFSILVNMDSINNSCDEKKKDQKKNTRYSRLGIKLSRAARQLMRLNLFCATRFVI